MPRHNGCQLSTRSRRSCKKLNKYQCQTCYKIFSKKSNLKRHKLIHYGDKDHQCDICKKKFNRKDNLKRHFAVHSGEKKYQCTLCHKRFNDKSNLNRHKRNKHK